MALRRSGIESQLVEIRSALGEIGAGLHIPGNGVRALYQLGIGDEARDGGQTFTLRIRLDARGRLQYEEEVGAVWGPEGFHLGIYRPVLHELLLRAANVRVRLGVEVAAIEQNESGARVRFSDGSEDEFDIVVGADGLHSKVRSLAISTAPPAYGGDMYWRGMVRRVRRLDNMLVFVDHHRMVGLVPVGNDQTYVFGHLASEEPVDDPIKGRLERFRARYSEFAGAAQEAVAAFHSDEQLHFSATELVQLESTCSGRVVVIGEAAHAHPRDGRTRLPCDGGRGGAWRGTLARKRCAYRASSFSRAASTARAGSGTNRLGELATRGCIEKPICLTVRPARHSLGEYVQVPCQPRLRRCGA